jgi:hypothetical protein
MVTSTPQHSFYRLYKRFKSFSRTLFWYDKTNHSYSEVESTMSQSGYPCISNPCKTHNQPYKPDNFPQPTTNKCLIITLPMEILQTITLYLEREECLPSQAALALTCKVICRSVGTKSWDLLRRENDWVWKPERVALLRLLERDWKEEPGLVFCVACEVCMCWNESSVWVLKRKSMK